MTINATTAEGIATIEIARPQKKNALTLAMYDAMTDALSAAVTDEAVRLSLIHICHSAHRVSQSLRRLVGDQRWVVCRFARTTAFGVLNCAVILADRWVGCRLNHRVLRFLQQMAKNRTRHLTLRTSIVVCNR